MGIDACIYAKAKDDLALSLPDGFSLVLIDRSECAPPGATHEIRSMSRYYSPAYPRGNWPAICHVLMALFAHEDVETVWYYGDCIDTDEPFTEAEVIEYSAYYMAHGRRAWQS